METSPPMPTLSLIKVLSESNRIINSQQRLFVTLSSLFLVPLSVAAAVFSLLQSLFSNAISKSFLNLTGFGPDQADDQATTIPTNILLFALAYGIFTLVFSIFAAISISYSVIHGFSGEPVKLKSAIKSIATYFFPLLGTTLLAQTIVSAIAILFMAVFALLIAGAPLLGFQIEFSSPYFLLLCFAIVIPLFSVLIYLQVNWSLLSVVVVAETTWGLEAMMRSASLIKGRRLLPLSLSLLTAFCYGVFAWSVNYLLPMADLGGSSTSTSVTDHDWKHLVFRFVVQVLVSPVFRMLVLLYEMTANAVLYVYRKKAIVDHGDNDFSGEYVSLPVDGDEKDPHVSLPITSSKVESYEV